MVEATIYHVKADIPTSYMEKLFDFIHSQYLLSQKGRFTNFNRQTTNQQDYLAYTIIDKLGNTLMQVEAKSDEHIEIKVTPLDPTVTQTMIEEAKQDIVIALQLFEENARKATLYFAWREGEEIVPESYTKPEKSFNRLFLETQILFFIVFIVFGTFIFIVLLTVSPEIF
jgi:hypothetical protein